jgi:hypothetical protein
MGLEQRTELIPAVGAIECGRGNYVLFLSATGTVNLRLENGGQGEGLNGVTGGVLVRRVRSWDNLRIIGTVGVSVTYLIGALDTDKDETDIRLQIATIAGVAAVRVQPATTLLSTAKAVLAAGASLDVAVNASRQNIVVCNESISGNSVWVRDQAATADAGIELQPGQSVPLNGTYAFRVRNNGAAACNISFNEEA